MSTLEGQTVLIVGGTSGIGFGVAKLSLLSNASCVIIASSNRSKVDKSLSRLVSDPDVARSVPDAKLKVKGEVVNAKESKEVTALMRRVGEIDHVVWTCGDTEIITKVRAAFTPDSEIELDELKGLYDVRFWGAVEAAKSAKIREGGSFTLTSGQVVKKPFRGQTIQSGVVGATDALTRGLAVDLAPIRVNCVSPGLVVTELLPSIMDESTVDKLIADHKERLLVKHVAYPDEVAEAYLFLMKCKYITGQRIDVDGGISLA